MSFKNNQGMHNIAKYFYVCKCFMVLMVLWGYNIGAEETYIVRKVSWGMSPEQVRKTETWKFSEDVEEDNERIIIYLGNLLSFPCSVEYRFEDQKLIRVFYVFPSKYLVNTNEAFELFTSLLTQKYGEFEKFSPPLKKLITPKGVVKFHTWHTKDGKTTIRIININDRSKAIGITYNDRHYVNKIANKKDKQVVTENPF